MGKVTPKPRITESYAKSYAISASLAQCRKVEILDRTKARILRFIGERLENVAYLSEKLGRLKQREAHDAGVAAPMENRSHFIKLR